MMSAIEFLWADGRLVDFVLVFIVLEIILVAIVSRLRDRGPVLLPFVLNVLSGACLVAALRAALHESNATIIVFCLSAALLCHLFDVYWRWLRPRVSV